MRKLREFWWRIWSLGRRRTLERGLAEELRFHVDQQTEKNRRAGVSPDVCMRYDRGILSEPLRGKEGPSGPSGFGLESSGHRIGVVEARAKTSGEAA